MDTIKDQLKEIMGYSAGPQKTCENCTFNTYSDGSGYLCEYNRAVVFQVVPKATCECFQFRAMKDTPTGEKAQESPA